MLIMLRGNIPLNYINVGKLACRSVFVLGLAYAVTTALGLFYLESPSEPIGNPYFTLMEILILLIAPLMTIGMVAVHYYASPSDKIYSFTAVLLMLGMTMITSSVHFVILALSNYSQVDEIANFSLFFSFRWFSVVCVLDILAWDWFFALSFLFASRVFKKGRTEKLVRILMIISGLLSLLDYLACRLTTCRLEI